jgi:hypothetical protein
LGASQFCKCHSERSDSEVKNPDLAQGLRSFATLRFAQDDKSGMHPGYWRYKSTFLKFNNTGIYAYGLPTAIAQIPLRTKPTPTQEIGWTFSPNSATPETVATITVNPIMSG